MRLIEIVDIPMSKEEKQAIFQYTTFLGCIIAVLYMLMDMCG